MQKRGGAEHPYLISFTLHGKIIDGWIWAPSERAAKHRLENELGGDAFDIRSIKLDQSGRAPRPGEYEHSRGSRYFVRKLPGMIGSPRASHRATRPAPNGNALGSMLHKGASKIASLVTGKRGR